MFVCRPLTGCACRVLLHASQVMQAHRVHNLVFSSSATVYGNPQHLPIDEQHPVGGCTNPYGQTKFFIEEMIKDHCKAEKVPIRRQKGTLVYTRCLIIHLCVSRTLTQCCCVISTQLELIPLGRSERTLRVSPTTCCHMSPRYMNSLPNTQLDQSRACNG